MVITHSMEACHTQRLVTNSQCQDPTLTQTWSEVFILRIFCVWAIFPTRVGQIHNNFT